MIEKSPAKRVNIMVWPFLETRRNGLQARFVSFAGTFSCWIPAFAGMTKLNDLSVARKTSPFRAGMDSADGVAVPVFDFG
ncbi:MAG: hypothetical protein Q7U78_13215 [Gallionella sp.]|nr:hypothetical protein [Gallionella sp.]